MDTRLTKQERIKKRAEYLRIQGSGRKLHTSSFVCYSVLPRSESGAPPPVPNAEPRSRLGITVSRRVGGAVMRNRVKRLIREAYRRHKPAFPSGLEFVVIAKPEAARTRYAEVEQELCELGRRIKSQTARRSQ